MAYSFASTNENNNPTLQAECDGMKTIPRRDEETGGDPWRFRDSKPGISPF